MLEILIDAPILSTLSSVHYFVISTSSNKTCFTKFMQRKLYKRLSATFVWANDLYGVLFVITIRIILIYYGSTAVVSSSHTSNAVGFFITTHWKTLKYLSIFGVHSQLGNNEYPRNRAQCQACLTLYLIICRLIPVRLYLSTLPSISLIFEWEIPNDRCVVSYTCYKPQDMLIFCSVGGVKMDTCRDALALIILPQLKESFPWILAIMDMATIAHITFAWHQINVNTVLFSTQQLYQSFWYWYVSEVKCFWWKC